MNKNSTVTIKKMEGIRLQEEGQSKSGVFLSNKKTQAIGPHGRHCLQASTRRVLVPAPATKQPLSSMRFGPYTHGPISHRYAHPP
jgi:hypothetical protein